MKELITYWINRYQKEEASVFAFHIINEEEQKKKYSDYLHISEEAVSIQIKGYDSKEIFDYPRWEAIAGYCPFQPLTGGTIEVYVKGHGLYRSYHYTVIPYKCGTYEAHLFKVERDDADSKSIWDGSCDRDTADAMSMLSQNEVTCSWNGMGNPIVPIGAVPNCSDHWDWS